MLLSERLFSFSYTLLGLQEEKANTEYKRSHVGWFDLSGNARRDGERHVEAI